MISWTESVNNIYVMVQYLSFDTLYQVIVQPGKMNLKGYIS